MQSRLFIPHVDEALGHVQHYPVKAVQNLQPSSNEKIVYFDHLRNKVEDIASRSYDNLVTMDQMHVVPQGLYGLSLDAGEDHMHFSSRSLQQFCSAIDIPSSYIRRCLDCGEQKLAADNMNHWITRSITDDKRELFLRATREPDVNRLHGVLSSRYVTFDDTEVMALTDEILGDQGGYALQNYVVSPEQLRMRLISDHMIDLAPEDNDRGGGLHLGLDVSNSRVGMASFSVKIILYRAACSNGAIFGANTAHYFKRRHSGTLGTEIRESFRTVLAELPGFMSHAQASVKRSMSKTISPMDLENLLNDFRVNAVNSFGLTEQIKEAVESTEMTSWGFINAITAVAQQYHLEQRERMETFAGAVLMR